MLVDGDKLPLVINNAVGVIVNSNISGQLLVPTPAWAIKMLLTLAGFPKRCENIA